MRLGAWLVLLLGVTLPLGSCSGGYPLPPTRCDQWCDVTKGATCLDYYDPASCVVQCEDLDLPADECEVPFDAALACFRKSPNAIDQRCYYDAEPDDCENELQWLMACAAHTLGGDLGSGE